MLKNFQGCCHDLFLVIFYGLLTAIESCSSMTYMLLFDQILILVFWLP